jgi:hypothetical protein
MSYCRIRYHLGGTDIKSGSLVPSEVTSIMELEFALPKIGFGNHCEPVF